MGGNAPQKGIQMFKRNHLMLDLFDVFVAEYEKETGASFRLMSENNLFQKECDKAFRDGATYKQAMDHLVKYTNAVLV